MKNGMTPFYLVHKNRGLFLVKDQIKQLPTLELSEQHLELTQAHIQSRTLIIRNLSQRIVSIKFMEHSNYSKNTEPLEMQVKDDRVYQILLEKINRAKYHKYKVEESYNK